MFDVPFWVLLTVVIIILYTTSRRHRERMEMIKRGMTPFTGDSHGHILHSAPGSKSLFFGLVGVGIGIAFIIGSYFAHEEDMVVAGLLFFFGGLALLTYWKLTEPHRAYKQRMYEQSHADTGKVPDTGDEADMIP